MVIPSMFSSTIGFGTDEKFFLCLFYFLNEFIDVQLRVQNNVVRLSILKKHTTQFKSRLCRPLRCVEGHAGLMGWPQYSPIWSVI